MHRHSRFAIAIVVALVGVGLSSCSSGTGSESTAGVLPAETGQVETGLSVEGTEVSEELREPTAGLPPAETGQVEAGLPVEGTNVSEELLEIGESRPHAECSNRFFADASQPAWVGCADGSGWVDAVIYPNGYEMLVANFEYSVLAGYDAGSEVDRGFYGPGATTATLIAFAEVTLPAKPGAEPESVCVRAEVSAPAAPIADTRLEWSIAEVPRTGPSTNLWDCPMEYEFFGGVLEGSDEVTGVAWFNSDGSERWRADLGVVQGEPDLIVGSEVALLYWYNIDSWRGVILSLVDGSVIEDLGTRPSIAHNAEAFSSPMYRRDYRPTWEAETGYMMVDETGLGYAYHPFPGESPTPNRWIGPFPNPDEPGGYWDVLTLPAGSPFTWLDLLILGENVALFYDSDSDNMVSVGADGTEVGRLSNFTMPTEDDENPWRVSLVGDRYLVFNGLITRIA